VLNSFFYPAYVEVSNGLIIVFRSEFVLEARSHSYKNAHGEVL